MRRLNFHRDKAGIPAAHEISGMPKEATTRRVEQARRAGKKPSTQAGEFVREEIDEIRAGKHGARSTKQAIAIGLSKARRAGVKLAAPKKGSVPERTQEQAARDSAKGERNPRASVSRKRSRATSRALKREGTEAASKQALSRHAHAVARRRSPAERTTSAKKAARTRAARG
jgi:hypothetical protein